MKGLVLAGGTGTRLRPLSQVVSKQLLPVYDKPMVYYPLGTLMAAGIRELCIISSPRDLPLYRQLLGNGRALGVSFTYVEQARPEGLAQAFILGANFIGSDAVALALGDNIFVGREVLTEPPLFPDGLDGATILACQVPDARPFAVVELDAGGRPLSIQEKPTRPRSSYAVPGLYFYTNDVVRRARALLPSGRGELEITDINDGYLRDRRLIVRVLSPKVSWIDAGTPDRLLQAGTAVRDAQLHGPLVGSLEEIAFRMGYIPAAQLERLSRAVGDSEYGRRLQAIAEGRAPDMHNGAAGENG